MPYDGERASKVSHFDIVKNPDVHAFLQQCSFVRVPSPEEAGKVATKFLKFAPDDNVVLPKAVLAIDGSLHEAQRDRQFPSTRVGYLKIGLMLVSLDEFATLRPPGEFFVDGSRVFKTKLTV